MSNIVGPISGALIGIMIIIFSSHIGRYITWTYQKFPKYKDGENSLGVSFNVRPFFIRLLGFVILLFSITGLVMLNVS